MRNTPICSVETPVNDCVIRSFTMFTYRIGLVFFTLDIDCVNAVLLYDLQSITLNMEVQVKRIALWDTLLLTVLHIVAHCYF